MGDAAAGTAVKLLASGALYREANLSNLSFAATADLQPVDGPVGQERALDAIHFGTGVDHAGFNLFVIGPNGARMQEAVKVVLAKGGEKLRPSDWVYVNNFVDSDRPIALLSAAILRWSLPHILTPLLAFW